MYDLSSFIKIHPGGDDMFNNLKSRSDITSFVYTYHKDDKKIPFYWSNLEIAYNCLLGIAYVSSYVYICSYPDSITLLKMIFFTLFGMGYGGLILHEMSHYTGFKNQKINVFLSNVIIIYNCTL